MEDGLCEFVGSAVEQHMFPGEESTTLSIRSRELNSGAASIPDQVDLGRVSDRGLSLFAGIVAVCEGGAIYGYAYAYAFWVLADLDPNELRATLSRLEGEALLDVAADVAPASHADLKLDLSCAQAVLSGARSCAAEGK